MDFTPEDIEAVQSCLEGIDRNLPVVVERAAAKLLISFPGMACTTGPDIYTDPQVGGGVPKLVVGHLRAPSSAAI